MPIIFSVITDIKFGKELCKNYVKVMETTEALCNVFWKLLKGYVKHYVKVFHKCYVNTIFTL